MKCYLQWEYYGCLRIIETVLTNTNWKKLFKLGLYCRYQKMQKIMWQKSTNYQSNLMCNMYIDKTCLHVCKLKQRKHKQHPFHHIYYNTFALKTIRKVIKRMKRIYSDDMKHRVWVRTLKIKMYLNNHLIHFL